MQRLDNRLFQNMHWIGVINGRCLQHDFFLREADITYDCARDFKLVVEVEINRTTRYSGMTCDFHQCRLVDTTFEENLLGGHQNGFRVSAASAFVLRMTSLR